jgi:hypothetical protein
MNLILKKLIVSNPCGVVTESLSGRLRGRDVLNAGDVQDGAFSGVFGETARIQLDSNDDAAGFDPSHVVIGDVKILSVRQAKAERLERLGVHAFSERWRANHGLSVSFLLQIPRIVQIQF